MDIPIRRYIDKFILVYITVMLKRSSNTQNVAWFVDLSNRGLLDLDPPYQRRSVWTKSYQRYFIDTIMKNFSSPPIFLTVQFENDGTARYAVVDGKQRLESILAFVRDEINLPDTYGDNRLNGKYFSSLRNEDKTTFWSYIISVETLSDFEIEEINESFDRLNRNVLRLTAQELRNARFDGRFINLVTELSGDPFWLDICISRRTTIRRMRDIEFISDLFLLTMKGIQTTRKEMLDRAYADFDEEILNEEEHRRKFEKVKAIIQELNLDICHTRLINFSDFYTLWSVLLEYIDLKIDLKETKREIISFLNKISKVEKKMSEEIEIEPDEENYAIYIRGIRFRPNEIRNRTVRKQIFQELIHVNDSSS